MTDDGRALFEVIYERNFPDVWRFAFWKTGSREDADEITAQVFAAAFETRLRYSPERGSERAWLLGIAMNRLRTHWRSRARRLRRSSLLDEQPSDPMEIEAMNLRMVLAQLPREKQQLLVLRFSLGLSHAEIARITRSSEAATKMAIHRLLRSLKEKVR